MFNVTEARDRFGRWTRGAGAAAAEWLSSGEAQKALSSLVTEDRIKSAVSIGIKSSLYHVAQFDDAMMGTIEEYVNTQVDMAAAHAQVSAGVARKAMQNAVAKLIAARKAAA
jgi:hypothetical protein